MYTSLENLVLLYGKAGAREAFERLCSRLIKREYPDAETVRITVGDGGVDTWVGDWGGSEGVTVFQHKYFPNGLGNSQRGQITKAYKTAQNNPHFRMRKWVLCLPINLSAKEQTWWNVWKRKEHLDIELWSALTIEGLLDKQENLEIKKEFFQQVESRQIGEMHEILMTMRKDISPSPPLTADFNRSDFFEHISLPPNYVVRTELLNEVKTLLLGYVQAEKPTTSTTASPIALHGMGGIGKSVLARALCDDTEVQTVFSDGILWVTLGQSAEIVVRLRELIVALGGTIPDNTPSVNHLKVALANLLRERTCLVILDDVWRHQDVEAFRVTGRKSQLLFTIRDAAIAEESVSLIKPLPMMTRSEALDLLEQWSAGRVGHADYELAVTVIERLGRLPLAVKLAGAQLQRTNLNDWIRTFNVTSLKSRRIETVHDSLEKTFAVSLDLLNVRDRRLYSALAIFRENEPILESGIFHLWEALDGLDNAATIALVDDLAARALLDIRYSNEQRTVIIHNLLRDFSLVDLGTDYILTHQAILGSYLKTRTADGWHDIPDDGYLYNHLTYHLEEAKQFSELHLLLAAEAADGLNAWYQAREQLGQTTGYIEDIERAWRSVDLADTYLEVPEAIGLQVRYALSAASLNSFATIKLPGLVVALVEQGLWLPDQALSYAMRIPEFRARVKVLGPLSLAFVELGYTQEALTIAQSVNKNVDRASYYSERQQVLGNLAIQFSRCGYSNQALAVANTIQGLAYRTKVLTAIATHSEDSLRHTIIATAYADAKSGDEYQQAEALVELLPHLASDEQPEVVELVLAKVEASRGAKSNVLGNLAPFLPELEKEHVLSRALEAALDEIDWLYGSASSLEALAPSLTEPLLRKGIAEALELPEEFKNYYGDEVCIRGPALGALAPRLAELGYVEEAIGILDNLPRGCFFGSPWADAVVKLSPYLSDSLVRLAVQELQHLNQRASEYHPSGDLILSLARRGYVDEAVKAALQLKRVDEQTAVLSELLPSLTSTQTDEILRSLQPRVLVRLVQVLPESQKSTVLSRLLDEARTKRDAELLVELADSLDLLSRRAVLSEALQISHRVGDVNARALALSAMAPYLSSHLLEQTISAIGDIDDGAREPAGFWAYSTRALCLAEIGPSLPRELLDKSLEMAANIKSRTDQEFALTGLLPRLTDFRSVDQVIERARTMESPSFRYLVLVRLIPHLLKQGRLDDALDVALDYDASRHDIDVQVNALRDLLQHLPNELYQKYLYKLRTTKHEYRAELLALLVPFLPEDERLAVLSEIFNEIWERVQSSIRFDTDVIGNLSSLAQFFNEPLLREAIGRASEPVDNARDRYLYSQVLVVLIPHLARLGHVHEAQQAARALRDVRDAGNALGRIVEYLPHELQVAAINEALKLNSSSAYYFLDYLPESLAVELSSWYKYDPMPESNWDWGDRQLIERRQEERARLAIRLAELGRPDEALRLMGASSKNTARAWAAVAPYLPPEELTKAVEKVESFYEERYQSEALAGLAAGLTKLQSSVLSLCWRRILHARSTHSRERLLLDMRSLAAVIAALGGHQAVENSAEAILAVCRFWP